MSSTPYPEPPTKYSGYSDQYFATEKPVKSSFGLAGYDRGELSLYRQRVVFRGMRVLVDCPNVTAVALVRKSFPWGITITVGVVATAMVYLTSLIPFTWRQPFPYIILAIFLVTCVKQLQEQWVEVLYSDGAGPRRAYFRRNPTFGSNIASTQQLRDEIKAEVFGELFSDACGPTSQTRRGLGDSPPNQGQRQ